MNKDLTSCCEYKEGPFPPSNTPTRLSDRTTNITDFGMLQGINGSITNLWTPSNLIFKPDPIIPVKLVVKDREVLVRFSDNTYRVAKCEDGDTFDLETGVLIAILKRYGGTYKTIKPFLEQVASEIKKYNAPREGVGENPPSELKSDKIEVGDTVEVLTSTPWFYKGDVGKVSSVDETDNSVCVKANNRLGYWIYMYDLKLIKKGKKR